MINALKNDVAAVRLWSSSSLAEIGNVSTENAQLAAEQLLINLKIDNESGVEVIAYGHSVDFTKN